MNPLRASILLKLKNWKIDYKWVGDPFTDAIALNLEMSKLLPYVAPMFNMMQGRVSVSKDYVFRVGIENLFAHLGRILKDWCLASPYLEVDLDQLLNTGSSRDGRIRFGTFGDKGQILATEYYFDLPNMQALYPYWFYKGKKRVDPRIGDLFSFARLAGGPHTIVAAFKDKEKPFAVIGVTTRRQ